MDTSTTDQMIEEMTEMTRCLQRANEINQRLQCLAHSNANFLTAVTTAALRALSKAQLEAIKRRTELTVAQLKEKQ
jgi:cytolysin (calcineurin-like family phosphatase)